MSNNNPIQRDLFSGGDQAEFPTTTVHQHRLQLFEPTRRPKLGQRTIETLWGSATVNGKLGQAHADVLEAISHQAKDWRLNVEDSTITVLIDPFKLRVTANGGKIGSGGQIDKLLLEIQQTVVKVIISSQGISVQGSLITLVDDSTMMKAPRGGWQKEDRPMWRITLGRPMVEMLKRDLRLDYNPEPIAALNNGISQAIARHIASHRNEPKGGWKLETLLKAVGADAGGTSLKHRRNELVEDADGLKKLGLTITQEPSAEDRRRTDFRIRRQP